MKRFESRGDANAIPPTVPPRDEAYRWFMGRPVPRSAFYKPGDADAADSRRLRGPFDPGRAALTVTLYKDGPAEAAGFSDAYDEHVTDLVEDQMGEQGTD